MTRPLALDHAVIAVSDWERSDAFYRDMLGAEIMPLGYGRRAYRLAGVQLNVHGPDSTPHPRPAQPVLPGNSDLCFRWPGPIADAVAHLRRHGVAIVAGPLAREGAAGRGESVYFRDPDGSLLELISYANSASESR